jgi:hypothetical protein
MIAYAFCWQKELPEFHYNLPQTACCLRSTVFQNPELTLWTHCIIINVLIEGDPLPHLNVLIVTTTSLNTGTAHLHLQSGLVEAAAAPRCCSVVPPRRTDLGSCSWKRTPFPLSWVFSAIYAFATRPSRFCNPGRLRDVAFAVHELAVAARRS